MSFFIMLRKEITEQWRTKRFLIVAAVLVIFGLGSPLLAKVTPELLRSVPGIPPELAEIIPTPTVADAVGQYVKNMSQFGILLAVLMSMGMVAQEKERGTAGVMLSHPVSRHSFLLAKFTAIALTFAASLAVAALGCWYYTLLLFKALPWGPFLAMNGLMLVVGVGSLPRIGEAFPGKLFSWGAALALGVEASEWTALWVSLGMIAGSLAIAWLVFRRQEIT